MNLFNKIQNRQYLFGNKPLAQTKQQVIFLLLIANCLLSGACSGRKTEVQAVETKTAENIVTLTDAQLNWTWREQHTTFKLGASNILDEKNAQTYGGPKIGRLAYFSVLYEH